MKVVNLTKTALPVKGLRQKIVVGLAGVLLWFGKALQSGNTCVRVRYDAVLHQSTESLARVLQARTVRNVVIASGRFSETRSPGHIHYIYVYVSFHDYSPIRENYMPSKTSCYLCTTTLVYKLHCMPNLLNCDNNDLLLCLPDRACRGG